MNKKERTIEELVILITVVLLFTLTILVFEKIIPSTFQSITGEVVTRVNIIQSPPVNCSFTLSSGLNLVSFFCISILTDKSNITSRLSNLYAIFEYQEESTDAWKIYNPHLPSFVIQDLDYMSRTKGYWLIMNSAESFSLEGGLRVPTSINLVNGWNLVGYPTNETKSLNTSFSSIEGNFTEARAYNSSSGAFISYVPGVGGALNQTEAYKGYWINVTTSEVWVVD